MLVAGIILNACLFRWILLLTVLDCLSAITICICYLFVVKGFVVSL